MRSSPEALRRKMDFLFWSLAALNAALLIVLLVGVVRQPGAPDGGRGTGVFLALMWPCLSLGVAMPVYARCRALAWRLTALCLVAGPGLLVGAAQLRSVYAAYLAGHPPVTTRAPSP